MRQYNVIVSVRFGFVYTERSNRLNGRFFLSVCLTALWQNGEKRLHRNKRSRGLHIRFGVPYKRVDLERIRCFCFSQVARDVQQVQATTNSPLCARMGYKPPTIAACYERRA